jgi:Protein kinase domain
VTAMTADEAMPGPLGSYHLLRRIGEGGMGVVYLAQDPGGRAVALKVLRSSVAGDPTARRRLAREVETMRRVRSPYVAEVIDADLASDTPYIVTRYVPGRTLDQVVNENGPLLPPALLRLACGLADALAAVHAAGVVHRDLKPGNVMLLGEVPVVIDFGIAQGPDATRLTMTGMFMGTPGYLAPEVIEGQPSTEASDIHAWGATVAFAACGHPPFGTGAYEAIFYRIVNGQPDLTGAPAPLLPLLTAALARDPARRPGAVQLSTRAAVLDPVSFAPGTVAAADGLAVQAAEFPVTRTDVANGAAGPGTPGMPAAATMDAVAPLAPGLGPAAGPAPGLAPPGPAVLPPGPGYGASGTRPMVAGQPGPAALAGAGARAGPAPAGPPVPADFADVLPPVRYQPAAGGRPGNGAVPPQPQAGGPPVATPRAAASPRGHAVTVVATMLVLAGVSVILPVAGSLTALILIILLRAGELAQERATARRSARGARASDPVLTAASFPWYTFRSLLGSLLLVPFALAVAVIAGGITILAVPGHPLPRAIAVAAGIFVAFYGLGPGSGRARRQLRRIFTAIARTGLAQAAVMIGMGALALATLAAAASWPSLYWPATAPGGFWHFGGQRLSQFGPVGHYLLSHLHHR